MNVEPLDSLSEEEMRQLLLKRKADKAAMGAAYSGVDESVGIPKGRFNPGQYAPTYGEEPPPGLPPGHYDRQIAQPPVIKFPIPKTTVDDFQEISDTPWPGAEQANAVKARERRQRLGLLRGQSEKEVGLHEAGGFSDVQQLSPIYREDRDEEGDVSGSWEEGRIEAARRGHGAALGAGNIIGRNWGMISGNPMDTTVGPAVQSFFDEKLKDKARGEKTWANYGGHGIEPEGTIPGTGGLITNQMLQSAVSSLPVTLGTVSLSIAGGMPLGLGAMFTMVAADDFGKNIAAGMDPDLAAEHALVIGSFEVITEMPFLRSLRAVEGVKQSVMSVFGRILISQQAEGVGEAANTIAESTYEIQRHNKDMTATQVLEAAVDSYIVGTLMATVVATPIIIGQSMAKGSGNNLLNELTAPTNRDPETGVILQSTEELLLAKQELIDYIEAKHPGVKIITDKLHEDTTVEGYETLDAGQLNEKTGKVEIYLEDAIVLGKGKDGEIRKVIDTLVRHESGHEILIGESAIRDNFFNNNEDSILAWLANSEAYGNLAKDYMVITNAAQKNPELATKALELQRLVTEEFINNTGEADIKLTSPVRLAVLQFARDMGVNVSSETDARLLLKDLIAGNIDKLRAQAESGGLIDPKRRDVLKAGAAIGAGLALEPGGMVPDVAAGPVEATSQYAGGLMRPGVAPEMEGVLRAASADAAPTTGLVGDVASRAFDDYDAPGAFEADQEAARKEREDIERRLEELKKNEEVPQKWRELDTEDLQTLAEANRAKDNPIWQAQFKELERRKAADETAATEVEEFETMGLEQARLEKQKVLEETHRILDEIEEAQQESLDSGTLSAQDRKSIKLAPDIMKLRRDTQNLVQKQKILERLEGDALELGKLVHRLNGVPHMKGRQSIGLETAPLDRDGFRAIMTDLVKGDTASAEAFIEGERPVLQQIQDAKQEDQVSKSQAAYAERVGKDRTALAPRRKKGTVSPLEGIMTPVLAKQEIDAQLEADVIDQATYDQKLDRIEEIQQTVKGTVAKGRALTKAAIDEGLLGVIDLQTMKDQAEILKRNPNILVRAKQQRPKAEVREEQKAAVTEGAKVTRIPADPEAAIKGKIDFDKGTTKREQRYGLENIAKDADIFTELDDMRTEQGESLGEGYGEVLERKSIKAVEDAKYKDKKKRGSITVVKVNDDGIVEYEMTTPQGVTTGQRQEEGFDTFISKFYQDYAVSSRVSEPFREWAKQHTEYQKEKYWDGDKVIIGEFVENFDKLWGEATLAGVKVPNAVTRLESERRSDRDPGVRQIKNKVRDMNAEYESFFGKNTFTPDHLSELLGSEIIGDVAQGKDIVYSSPTSNMHAANNLAIMPKLVHNAVNAWIKAGRTASERAIRKNSPNKYTGMINDAAFIASNPKYKNISDFIRAVGKLGNMTNAREIERGLLNATANLLNKDSSNAPWNKDGWKATPTPQDALIVDNAQNTYNRLSKKLRQASKANNTTRITADFTSGTMRTLFQYIFGAPVKRIADFNKMSAFGVGEQGTITAATVIANAIQRSLSSQARPEGMEQGTDLVQETSLRNGEFYSRLFKVFAGVTNNEGIITPEVNAQIVDHIAGKPVEFTSKNIEKAAKELKTFMEDMYQYAKDRTSALKTPLDLRGAGDSVLPRVWNIDYIATRRGKKEFLAAIANKFTDPTGKLVFEDANITPEDLYAIVVNSGGFVQGEWTNMKADQTTSKAELEKDQLMQEYLDSLSTEELADAGLLVDDLQSVIPRFVQKAVERTEYSAVFGVNDEILRSLVQMGVDQIKVHNEGVMKMEEGGPNNLIDDKAFQKAVWDMSKILRNKFGYDMADMPTRKWLQRIANVEVVAKLPLVTLASLPEFFTPMLKGDVRPDKFAIDFALASAWAGYKGMNGLSKLVFNTHLPAMLKHSSEIEGLGIISDIQLLREMGIADIQSMGDTVATRYANPNFARGGIRAATKGTVGARIPKGVRAVFNMQTYMQATMLTTITEMQQFMALRNYQRHMMERVNFVNKNKGKALKGRSAVRLRQYKQDLLDYGVTEDMDLSTPEGEAAFNAGALRFIDQVITRPNDATTAKIFKNPLTAPLVLFKRFITTYGNTLLTSVGTDFATKVDNVERAKQVGKLSVAAAGMYGAVIFAEILRGAIKGDLDEEDFNIKPEDWKTFMRRVDRMGVLSAPGSVAANLSFPSKAWYGDTGTNRMVRELTGPFGSDIAGTLDFVMSDKGKKDLHRLLKQVSPTAGMIVPKPGSKKKKENKKKRGTKLPAGGTF